MSRNSSGVAAIENLNLRKKLTNMRERLSHKQQTREFESHKILVSYV